MSVVHKASIISAKIQETFVGSASSTRHEENVKVKLATLMLDSSRLLALISG